MTTVPNAMPQHKAPRAYYAILDETPGALTLLDGRLSFLSDDGDLVAIEPEHLNFLVTLGVTFHAKRQYF